LAEDAGRAADPDPCDAGALAGLDTEGGGSSGGAVPPDIAGDGGDAAEEDAGGMDAGDAGAGRVVGVAGTTAGIAFGDVATGDNSAGDVTGPRTPDDPAAGGTAGRDGAAADLELRDGDSAPGESVPARLREADAALLARDASRELREGAALRPRSFAPSRAAAAPAGTAGASGIPAPSGPSGPALPDPSGPDPAFDAGVAASDSAPRAGG
jgi:hypothetical protein